MISFGLALESQPEAVSVGIISGSTLEKARALWERRTQVRGETFFVVNAANPAAYQPAQILAVSGADVEKRELSKTGFVEALQAADYLTFTGHGANSYLRIDEDTTLAAQDLPTLDAALIGTGSCQTFQLWNENSVALQFADQGAAAYAGFVYSPNEGYLLGEFDGLPFRYTWPDFPIGYVLQAQNRGTVQVFAAFPYQFLLGDPRIALQGQPPYQLVTDRMENGQRFLAYRGLPHGVVPIRIPAGAEYRFVEVIGWTAAAEQDPFYNRKLQMINLKGDKLLLLDSPGGEITLRLSKSTPFYWFPIDILLDSFDHTLLYSQQSGGDVIGLGLAILPLGWLGWQAWKKRLSALKVRLAIFAGLAATVLHGLYAFLRLSEITITSKQVAFSPLSLLDTFVLIACGALIFFQVRARLGKLMALAVATFNSWLPMVFGGLVVTVFNQGFFIPQFGAPLYNYALAIMPAIAFLVTFMILALVFGWLDRLTLLESR